MSYQSMQFNIAQIKNPAFVAAVGNEELGRKAFGLYIDRDDTWPEEMQQGWNAAFDESVAYVAGDSADDYMAVARFVDSVLA